MLELKVNLDGKTVGVGVKVGERWFRKWTKGGRMQTAWSLAGAKLWMRCDMEKAMIVVEKLQRRGIESMISWVNEMPRLPCGGFAQLQQGNIAGTHVDRLEGIGIPGLLDALEVLLHGQESVLGPVNLDELGLALDAAAGRQ